MRLANTNKPNNIIIDIAELTVIGCARVACISDLIRARVAFVICALTRICRICKYTVIIRM